jgi:ABC transporter substrate binding protein
VGKRWLTNAANSSAHTARRTPLIVQVVSGLLDSPPAILHRGAFMRRIGLAVVLAVSLFAVPLAAEAQQSGKVYRIGVLSLIAVQAYEDIFRQSLRELGYVEGKNLTIEWRRAEGKSERLADLAAELVALLVDVIVTASNAAASAAKAATTTIPIVMTAVSDPERRGLVANLSRPGGNVTGFTLDPGAEIAGKMVELLKEAAPRITRVAVLSAANRTPWPCRFGIDMLMRLRRHWDCGFRVSLLTTPIESPTS